MQKAYKVLAAQLKISNNEAKALIDSGAVSLGGKRLTLARELVSDGAKFALARVQKPRKIFEDADIIAVDKPPFATSEEVAREFGAGLLNRLDRETSGVVLLYKNEEFRARAVAEFAAGRVKKLYYAVVRGVVAEAFEVNEPLLTIKNGGRGGGKIGGGAGNGGKISGGGAKFGGNVGANFARESGANSNLTGAGVGNGAKFGANFAGNSAKNSANFAGNGGKFVSENGAKSAKSPAKSSGGAAFTRVDKGGKPALTRVTPVSVSGKKSLVLVEIPTGRTHQIRVHLAWAGHGVVGDEKYAKSTAKRLFLHSYKTELLGYCFTAPLERTFGELFEI